MIQNPIILFVNEDAEHLQAVYCMILYEKSLGKLTTEERRASKIGKACSADKAKMRAAKIGKSHSAETKARKRATCKKRKPNKPRKKVQVVMS
mmetsp:Transcript_25652/g.46423  ORF Transcript_25652/g.46423 Transcript_25652/m.46423 type:complete len:93 (+) Transcript_25652:1392-1670(+)